MKSINRIFYISVFCCTFGLFAQEYFPAPEILKDNIDFWKKIYTEVSVKEGILHDREFPMIIYKKIYIGDRKSRSRKNFIKSEKNKVKELLNNLLIKDKSSYNSEEMRIYNLFEKYNAISQIKDAGNRIRFQQGQKERFVKGLYRSGAYIDSIRIIFKKYNVPERLIYLPHVESSFDPDAYSKVGAAGLWQFMRSTGKRYMRIDYLIDERRDPIKSAYAAAKLLTKNYSELGAWPLAITAYNHGLTGMKRAVKRVGSKDIGIIIQKHKSRTFRFASKNFYSCFLAASEIAMNWKEYFPNVTFATPIAYRKLKLPFYIKPSVFCKISGINLKEFKELNPAIRPVVFSSDLLLPKGYEVHIPLNNNPELILSKLNELPDSLKVKKPPVPKYYRVRRGDNLYAISKRLGISLSALIDANNIGRGYKIYAGQLLKIPAKTPKIAFYNNVEMEDSNLSKKVFTNKKPDNKQKEKDKLKAEILPDSLKEVIMKVAQKDEIVKTVNEKSHFDADIYNFDYNYSKEKRGALITVSVDETIGHYAEWLDIATMWIRRFNHMGRSSFIHIGQKLWIPGTEKQIEEFTAKRIEYHMSIEEDFYNSYKVSAIRKRTIKSGDNLWTLLNNEGDIIPMWLFKKYNSDVDIEKLSPGMIVNIPIIISLQDDNAYTNPVNELFSPIDVHIKPF